MSSGFEVFVFKGTKFLGSRCFSATTLVIGQGRDVGLRLQDAAVEDQHAMVRVEGDDLVIADVSQSGMVVNGQRCKLCRLTSLDEVAIGPFRLKLALLSHDTATFGEENSAASQLPRPAAAAGGPPYTTDAHTVPERSHHQDRPAAEPVFDEEQTRARSTTREQPTSFVATETQGQEAHWEEESPSETDTVRRPDRALDGTAYADVEDDEEAEEELWEEPFSLLENIVKERFKTPIDTEPYAAVEVIHYSDNEIIDVSRANPGQLVRVGADKFELLKLESDRALLYFQQNFSGTLVSKGKARPLKAFCTDNYLVDDELFGVVMQEGDYAQVLREGTGYLVRFVKPPRMPHPKAGLHLTLGGLQALAASVAIHFLLVVVFAVLTPEAVLPVSDDSDRFGRVVVKPDELDPVLKDKDDKTAPKKEDAPKPEVTKEDAPKPIKRLRPTPVQNVPRTEKQRQRQQKKAVEGVMSALENLKPAAGPGPGRSDLKALASNISAVRSPAGATAGFRVSGVIGRIGGDGVRLAGGFGGGGKDTKVGGQLLTGGSKIGHLGAATGTGNKVRGRVSKPPTRSITTSGGQCDRTVIQNVVGQNMHLVQACYERALLTTPGLAGKIVFDWTIVSGGGVSGARMFSSSMSSPAVATCILMLIRSWKFSPCPVGGPVEVRYPFIFKASGF